MNVDHLLTETATVTSRTPVGKDAYGNDTYTESSRTTICSHQQTVSGEFGSLVDQTWDAFFPPDDPLRSTDKVTINGIAYEVIGGPNARLNPRTVEAWQVEAQLRRTDG